MGSVEDLERLRQLVRDEPRVGEGLDDRCFLLADPDEDAGEWTDCPPRPGVEVARDGTDHEFCLLDNGAVVLYSPLADEPYLVVGQDLREFLALLLDTNGSGIGALGDDREEGLGYLTEPEEADESSIEETRAMQRLTEVFSLEPWADHDARLRELQPLLGTG